MAGVPDNLNIYSGFDGTQLIGYLGTYEIPAGFSGNSINNIMSSLGLSIPQGADGFTINALGSIVGEYGLNETIPGRIFAASGTTYQGWFTYPPEKITGFFLDGTEYKIGGDEAAWGNISGTLSNQTDLQTALNAKATKKYVDDNKGTNIVYCTQSEYDALPSSKTSDGKVYMIYTIS